MQSTAEKTDKRLSAGTLAPKSVSKGSKMDYAVFMVDARSMACIIEAKQTFTIHAPAQVGMLHPFESLLYD